MVRAPDKLMTRRPPVADPPSAEPHRARYPDTSGFVERDGVRVFYEVYGTGEPTILLLPTWSIIHSRFWKFQVPYLARAYRVVTFDGRGNGRSDRPATADAYAEAQFAADALAVMEATGTRRAVLVALSRGAQRGLLLASDHPDRVAGAVFIGPSLPLAAPSPGRDPIREFTERHDSYDGWNKYNSHYWRRDYRGFLDFFFDECFPEAHSTKPVDDAVGWGLETDADSLILTQLAARLNGRDEVLSRCARVQCPVLVIHGSDDRIQPHAQGRELAEATRGRLITLEGAGHIPNLRDPVRVNLAIHDFIRRLGLTS